MKPILLSILLTIFSLNSLLADEVKVNDIFKFNKVTKYVFVEEVPIGDDFGYKKIKDTKNTDIKLKNNLDILSKTKGSTEMNAPFIGILANVLFLDADDKPVFAISVINFNRTIVLRDIKKVGDNLMIGNTRIELSSNQMSKWVYDIFKVNFPKKFERQQAFYKKTGHTIESLLFPEINKQNKANKSQ